MTMFCDICRAEYENGDLRATSKYCMQCGEHLPTFILDAIVDRQRTIQQQANGSPIQPATPYTPPRRTQYNPVESLRGARLGVSGSPDTLPSETPLARNASTRASRGRRSPSPSLSHSPSIESLADSDYEETARKPPEIESEDDDLMSIDPPSSALSLNIQDYNLPPPFPAPERCNRPFPRRIIAKILGGGPQTTWPLAGDRRHPMYACVRSNLCPILPSQQGAHGIMITGTMPKQMVRRPYPSYANHSLNTTLSCS